MVSKRGCGPHVCTPTHQRSPSVGMCASGEDGSRDPTVGSRLFPGEAVWSLCEGEQGSGPAD